MRWPATTDMGPPLVAITRQNIDSSAVQPYIYKSAD
jgi:hypothetical protein